MTIKITAHDIASSPKLYFCVISRKQEWECMGYSRSGKTIKFARLEPLPNGKITQKNIYLHPDTEVKIIGGKS